MQFLVNVSGWEQAQLFYTSDAGPFVSHTIIQPLRGMIKDPHSGPALVLFTSLSFTYPFSFFVFFLVYINDQ